MAVLRTSSGTYLQTSTGNLLQTSGAGGGAPAEPDPATATFNMDAGFDWVGLNNAINALPNNSEGRPTANGRIFTDSDGTTAIYGQVNYEQPTVVGSEYHATLWTTMAALAGGHTQYVPFAVDSPNFGSAKYININGPIRHYVDFEISGDVSGFTWITILDHLPGTWPAGWADNFNSPLSFYVYPNTNKWQLELRGSDQDNTTWDRNTSFPVQFSAVPLLGKHTLVLEYWLGFEPAGDHYTKCWLDGVPVCDDSGQNSISATGGQNGSMFCKVGAYSSGGANDANRADQSINFSKHRIYDI